jgi:hypothetical protein
MEGNMAGPHAFFKELKEWSDRKLNLLENYLEVSTYILKTFGTVYYIDGFAGAGRGVR